MEIGKIRSLLGSSVLKEHIREPQRLCGVQDLTNKNYKVPQKGPPGSFSHELLLHQGLLSPQYTNYLRALMSTEVPCLQLFLLDIFNLMNALGFHCPVRIFSQAGDTSESLHWAETPRPGSTPESQSWGKQHTRELCHQAETLGSISVQH